MKSCYRVGLCILVLLSTSFTVLAVDDLPELKFEKYELANGLDVILHEDHSIPMVTVNIWYHVGAKNEIPGRTGFAHLFEHMMFQGSEHFNQNFTEGITKYGGVRNGSTSADRTNYWDNMPGNYLEKTLWLEADRMGYLLPAVTQERLDIQRDVVMNEKRERYDDQPYGSVTEVTRRLMYPDDHPYSWTTIGKMEDIEAASLEDVKDFFRRYYAPNNASLCIAGDFDPQQAKEWVETYFGPIPPGPPIDRLATWVPEMTQEIRTVMTDKVELPRVYISWHTPAFFAPGDAEFDLLAGVIAGGKSSRLYKVLVYEKQIAQDVTAYQESREIGSAFHIIVTAKDGGNLDQLEDEVDRVLNELLATGITEDEFERSRTGWESLFVRRLEDLGGFGGRADLLNSYNTYLGDPGKLRWDKKRYTDATIESTLDYVRQYLRPDARLVLQVYPQGGLAASDSDLDMAVEPGPQADPTFAPPEIQQTTLANGMELYLVENHNLPLVQINMVVKSGWAADPLDRPGTASLTSELINEGTKNRTALEISDEARRLGLNFGAGSTFDYSTVNLNAMKKNLDPALELMRDVLLNPTFPEDELQLQKDIYLGRLKQESSQPFTVAYKTFLRELYGADHPYGQPYTGTGTEESITAVTRSDLQEFYRTHYTPNNIAAIVVGDMTLSEAKKKLEHTFKDWKECEVPVREVPTVEMPVRTKLCLIDFPGSTQSTIILGNLSAARSDPMYLPSTIVSEVLGGGPSARLYKNLREEKAYTYGAYSFVNDRRTDGAFVCYAQVQTEVTREAIAEFMKELRGMQGAIPLDETELGNCKNKLIKGFPQGFRAISDVAEQIRPIALYDLSPDEWRTFTTEVNAMDVARTVETAKQCIKPDELLIVVVGDKAKIEEGIRGLNLGDIQVLVAE